MKSGSLPHLLAALLLAATAVARTTVADEPRIAIEQAGTRFERDRNLILGMAGTFKVRFDFRETTAWQADYTPVEPKVVEGREVVLVVEDSGRDIRLQHLLLVGEGEGTTVIKHWRQDWAYEPETVLTYAGGGTWKLEPIPEEDRRGRWSQTVWQTDDSPRYSGLGAWTDEGGVPRWHSSWTWRPLARRDAVRAPVYDRYLAINRHSPTPDGWIHWQDNLKMGPRDGVLVPFAQEIVLNTYDRIEDETAEPANAYWAKSADYWAEVRTAWDTAIAGSGGVIVVEEVADTGSAAAGCLTAAADALVAGTLELTDAVDRARAAIARIAQPRDPNAGAGHDLCPET